ncbi:MAG TPA: MaoC family dehydratase N-terminal domain-containing protein [Nocardioides sp.]|uniref:FAS1-like dehydratase domain-containing protein n=1 Tax=Nocardioides sp. TaxID=35761 RepID=UPI002E33EC3E|nr:MaoC family dehydratase N-terminal domain-containing protein [Nocardioides sp.]HEX3930525.1 MaoC family dehydratase N-terminal domain-containing protein [Nocardioides sp.]
MLTEPIVNEPRAADISPEMLDRAEALIGVWLRRDVHWPAMAEDLAPIDVRRWAHYSVGDDNPLWSDEEYARRTRWGGMIAPPTFLYSVDSTIVAPGLPGIQWIYGGTRWENFRPVRVGDRITARARLIGMRSKSGRHARNLVIQTGEILYYNQRDELVSRAESDVLRVPRRRSSSGLVGFEERRTEGRHQYSAEEIETVRQAYLNEERRGAEPRYWEDVEVGDQLPTIPKGPLTLVDILAFYVGRRNTYPPLKLAFAERERHPANVYVSPSTGIPVHPAAGHIDDEIAHEVGMPGPYDQGWMRANWMGHLVTNWAGDDAFVRRLSVRLATPNLVGDLTWCNGTVTAKRVVDGEHLVDLDCWGETQRGERNTIARATVRLPSRSLDVDAHEGGF